MTLEQAISFFTIGFIYFGARKFELNGRTKLDLAFEVDDNKVTGVIIADELLPIKPNRVKLIEIARERDGRLLVDIEVKYGIIYDAKIITDILWFVEVITTKFKDCAFYSVEDVIDDRICWEKILGYVCKETGDLGFKKLDASSFRETVSSDWAVIVDGHFGIVDAKTVNRYFDDPSDENRFEIIENGLEIGTDYILSRTISPFLAMAVNGEKTVVIDNRLDVVIHETPNIWAMASVNDDGQIARGFYHVFMVNKNRIDSVFDVPIKKLEHELEFLAVGT